MTFKISINDLMAHAANCKTARLQTLRKSALRRFQVYVGADKLSSDVLTREYVDDYLSWMVKGGASPKTIDLYRNELRAMLIEVYPSAEGQIKQAFVKARTRRGAKTHGLNVEQLRLVSKAEFGDREDLTQARDLFMFCVYCGGLDYNAAKSLTKSMVGAQHLTLPSGLKVKLDLNVRAIISMYDADGCAELFPFCRFMTEAAYADKLKELGVRLRVQRIGDHHAEAKAWLSVAKDMKVDVAVMAACAYKHVDILTHYSGAMSRVQRKIDAAMLAVSAAVVDNTEHWYAMKLRDRVTPETVSQMLLENEKYPELRHLKTYYPMEDIKVRVSGKWKQDTKAFIKDVMFFRTNERFVNPLFMMVRNMAWIFRQSNTPSSPYAVISQREMENFQRAISQFTDDIAVSIVENCDIKVGKKVKLVSGEFAGCEGIIEGQELHSDVPEIRDFYVRFTSNNSFKFQIKVSEGMLTVID